MRHGRGRGRVSPIRGGNETRRKANNDGGRGRGPSHALNHRVQKDVTSLCREPYRSYQLMLFWACLKMELRRLVTTTMKKSIFTRLFSEWKSRAVHFSLIFSLPPGCIRVYRRSAEKERRMSIRTSPNIFQL